jgi:hypothetical protein
MVSEIDEPINVGAIFSRGAIKPVWFSWNGRQIRIREVAFTWKTQEGNAGLLHFSVSDGQGMYEVAYNMKTMRWRLLNSE